MNVPQVMFNDFDTNNYSNVMCAVQTWRLEGHKRTIYDLTPASMDD